MDLLLFSAYKFNLKSLPTVFKPQLPKGKNTFLATSSLLLTSLFLEHSNPLSFLPSNSAKLTEFHESWHPKTTTPSSSSIATAARSSHAPPTASSDTSAVTQEYSPSTVQFPFQVHTFASFTIRFCYYFRFCFFC